ncbi:Major facilitator superfamily domain general substrate transporter [Penicillium majusculum]|nr:Major facilitator superfamily domain general substrate transporter [Penicillium majusculum]
MAEMSLTEKERGPEVAFQCIFLVSGCAFAYWVDFGFTRLDNQVSWRIPIGFQAVLGAVSGVGMFLLPDTPRWYYVRGRLEEGDEVLSRLFDRSVLDSDVQTMRESILASLELESEETKTLNPLDLFWDRTNLRVGRRLRIAFLILSVQQMMGINVAVYYSVTIFAQIGLSSTLSQLLAAVMNTIFAIGSLFLPSTIERFGRRNILMYSAGGLTVCLSIFVAMIGSPGPTLAKQWVAVAAIIVYNLIFGYGWIGVCCMLTSYTIAPLRFRHIGGAASAFGEWLFCFITVFAGGIGLEKVGWKLWLWCLLSCAVAVPFVYFLCPETTGKTLEEIDLLFQKESEDDQSNTDSLDAHSNEKKEVQQFHEETARRSLQIAIAVSAGSAYLLFGYDQGVLGGLVSYPGFLTAIVQASTYSAGQLIAGRIISGIGNGINTSTVPVYVSETSRTAFGTVVAYWLDYGMIRTQIGEVVWRFPLAFQNFFALITIITMPLLPESPRWLYSHGHQREAISVLSRLLSLSQDHPDVCTVVAEMEQALSVEQNNKQKFSISSLLFEKTEMKNARRLTLCFVIQFFQQFTGINVIAFYVTIVLETNVGLSRELSSLVAGFIQIAFWVGTFPPIFLIDRLGRRKVLMLGSTMLCLALVLFTVGIALKTPASSRLALGMLIIYEISFGMSWNSVPWLYAPEITPLNIRHVGAAVGCFSEWLWTFVRTSLFFPRFHLANF